jgi:hypothetical protein
VVSGGFWRFLEVSGRFLSSAPLTKTRPGPWKRTTAVCKRQTAKQFATVQYCQKPLHLGFSYCQPLQGHQSAYCQSQYTQRPSTSTNTCPSPFDTNSHPRLLRPVYNSPSPSHKSSIRSSTSPRHTSCSRSARTPYRPDYCRAAAWVVAAASSLSCSPAPTQPCSRRRNRARPAEAGFWARSGLPLTNSCELAGGCRSGEGMGDPRSSGSSSRPDRLPCICCRWRGRRCRWLGCWWHTWAAWCWFWWGSRRRRSSFPAAIRRLRQGRRGGRVTG